MTPALAFLLVLTSTGEIRGYVREDCAQIAAAINAGAVTAITDDEDPQAVGVVSAQCVCLCDDAEAPTQ